MKKIISAVLVTFFLCTTAYAVRITHKSSGVRYTSPKRMRDNLFTSSTKVSTTGLTYSTSSKNKKKTKKATLKKFVAYNLDNLSIDIAKGSGEYLNALAEIIEVSDSSKERFYSNLKKNFDSIFPSAEVDHKYVITEISRISKL